MLRRHNTFLRRTSLHTPYSALSTLSFRGLVLEDCMLNKTDNQIVLSMRKEWQYQQEPKQAVTPPIYNLQLLVQQRKILSFWFLFLVVSWMLRVGFEPTNSGSDPAPLKRGAGLPFTLSQHKLFWWVRPHAELGDNNSDQQYTENSSC